MAPIKEEEHMKEKLEKRRLQPSPESWATLSKRLDAEQKGKNKSMFWWFGLAASIVGILFVTILYFNNKPFENSSSIIVDTNKNDIQEIQNEQKTQITDIATDSDLEDDERMEIVKNPLNERVFKSNVTVKTEKNTIQKTMSNQYAVVDIENDKSQEKIKKATEIKKSAITFEDQKVIEVITHINDLKSKGNPVTDAEIDSLLKKAQKEILSNRIYNENTRMVDANALLQDVEEDLQQSFRSKVFEALQSGYESVKTAVAERNN